MKKCFLQKLGIMLAVMLSLGLALASCDIVTTGDGSGEMVPGNNLAAKLAWLQANAVSGDSYIVELDANESTAPVVLGYTGITGVTIYLRGGGSNRTISLSSRGNMITVGSGVTLVLDNNITLIGFENNSAGIALVSVGVGGTLVMNAGAAISGNNWDGVWAGGAFTMNGGTISGSNRVGVWVNGAFTMNGGTISGNGGGGNIDGGVYANEGNFIMNDGAISGNTGCGVVVGRGVIFTMKGGTISGHSGSGVLAEVGTINMSGGTISGNTGSTGGGVNAFAGVFNMTGGTISGNTADQGGGVFAWVFTKTGGTIAGSDAQNGNVATQSDGGHAVYCHTWNGSNYINIKRKDSSSGPNDNLSYNGSTGAATGAWDS